MILHERLEPQFVQYIPTQLEPGILYISMEYATATHKCCCGCGEEVVTPFTPTDWRLTFDGETVSLWPSVGSWSLPCRSHYIIENNRVFQASPWSDRQIAFGRTLDKAAKARHYGAARDTGTSRTEEPDLRDRLSPRAGRTGIRALLARLWR